MGYWIVCDNVGGRYWWNGKSALGWRMGDKNATIYDTREEAEAELSAAKKRCRKEYRALVKIVEVGGADHP